MASLNKVMLIGNLTRDPEVRHTPKGTVVGEFGLAMNMTYRTQGGEDKEDVCYVDVVVWGRQAETCQQYLSKGRQVFIEGRLQLDQWESPQGEKRSRLRVRAERVQFLSNGQQQRSSSPTPQAVEAVSAAGTGRPEFSQSEIDGDDEIPF